MSYRPCVLVSCALLLFLPVRAQSGGKGIHAGFHFLAGFPAGEFKTNITRNGYGISGQIGYAPAENPFFVGLEFAYANYGSETRTERFSTTIPDVLVDVNTDNNIVLGDLQLRLQPNTGFFRPYLEGAVGFNYLFTETTIKNRGGAGEEVASSTNFDDFAFQYGGGGGMMFRVYESDDPTEGLQEVLVDVRVRYLMGGEAEYLKEGSIRRENGQVAYDVLSSKTNLMTLQIGAALRW
ncbi:MAG: hypothetical protein WB626_08435 [Bacteroidota bacterium]